jgi:hypothetical protein
MKILLKDMNRMYSYGEIHDCNDWDYKNGLFIVKGEKYSREKGEVIYEPTKNDIVEAVKDLIAYFSTYLTIKKEIDINV